MRGDLRLVVHDKCLKTLQALKLVLEMLSEDAKGEYPTPLPDDVVKFLAWLRNGLYAEAMLECGYR